MPLSYDQISAITQKKFIPKLADNIFDISPILQRGKKKYYEKIDGGTSIMLPLGYAMTTASDWYTGAETLDTTDNDVITAAEYQWKQIYANISVNRLDELKNSGDSQILNFVKQKTMIAEKTMMDKFGTGIYSAGTNAKSILGLRMFVDTDSTVGGISQSSYSWWQAQVDSTTTTLTIAAMQSRFNAASLNNEAPSVVATTKALCNAYYALLQPQQRFTDSETAKGGFASLMFNGIPVVSDSYAPTSHMLFLNEKYLHMFVHKDEDMRFEPFQKPINQNVKVVKIYWAGVFVLLNNRLHAGMTALTA